MYNTRMDYAHFRRQLARAGLSSTAFADLLGMNPKSISNYAAVGVVPSHLAVIASLMAKMADHELDYRAVLKTVPVGKKMSRGAREFSGPRSEATNRK